MGRQPVSIQILVNSTAQAAELISQMVCCMASTRRMSCLQDVGGYTSCVTMHGHCTGTS